MPGAFAHAVITDGGLARYLEKPGGDPSFRAAAQRFRHYTRLGCVSPDYAYVDVLQIGQTDWADHMHYDHTGDLVQTMARQLLELKGKGLDRPEFAIPFAWALGYIAHVTTDLIIHPIVRNIVGDYLGHEAEHRHCEMIQDVYIYSRVRNGEEIQHSHLLNTLRDCSDPGDSQKIHPILRNFWNQALRQNFPAEYALNPPDIDVWHASYARVLGIAGRPSFLGRFDPDHKITYKATSEITPDERTRFLQVLPLPGGTSGTYDALYEKAIGGVVSQWVAVTQSLGSGNLDVFLAGTPNCDLDTGEIGGTPQLQYWA